MRGGAAGTGDPDTRDRSGAILSKRGGGFQMPGVRGKGLRESIIKQNWEEMKKLNFGLGELSTPWDTK